MPSLLRQVFCSVSLASLSFLAPAFAETAPPVTLNVHVQQVKAKSSPTLYGLMTEEINYSYDGGLYAELIRNRTFFGDRHGVPSWRLVERGESKAEMVVDKTTGPSQALPYSMKLTIEKATANDPAGISNQGYWGIPLRPRTTYKGSFYAKASDTAVGPVRVDLVSDETGAVLTHTQVTALSSDWKKYDFTLTANAQAPSSSNHLVFSAGNPGTIWFSLISLFPPTYHDRENGNRIDLMEKMAAMKPSFLRFPGGNYLEGDHIPERYEWKKTIGPLVDRPTHPSPWRYHSSDGLGLLEFLEWCEDLQMQPVLAVYAGYSMQQEFVKPGADLDPYVADALDEIEYVTGDASTKWGAERVKDGHPAPFALNYVEIGNEDFFDKSGSYDGRYAQFYKAIKAKYPNLQLIATTPVKEIKPDVIDDHYYRNAQQFYDDVHHYDKTDRNGPKIFVGEWATREGSPTPDFGAALGDAAWMTGMERNSDIIVMASYAPLLVNVNPGGMQWESDLIGYDALSSYGSPSYYAQVLFGEYHGDEIPETSTTGDDLRFFYSVTRKSDTGEIFIKLVNATSDIKPVSIALDGAPDVKNIAKVVTLRAGTLAATNSIRQPTTIVPIESRFERAASEFTYELPPYSIQVIRLETK
ncbi:alpha-N-arabinofuranosidase [Silvibacterium bohemicum]|uniref:non-reducing end alpha-L-arabinofuranosidase n=1 Tax=Silvibacterium bohemicum TaxID=1577686 RepID=A0A841K358_9BACT|nr:alpha-L-arabinofuranosidase C-terminal domain-containing protein [Silvibacterium bohemicum]MBB6147007.1 alpha-N-arabinofuranosidase [Silvibacterium bohemicum]